MMTHHLSRLVAATDPERRRPRATLRDLRSTSCASAQLASAVPLLSSDTCRRTWSKSADGIHGRTTCRAWPFPSSRPAHWRRNSRSISAGCGLELGATLTGIAFIVPSFLMVLVLAVFYVQLRRPDLDTWHRSTASAPR